MSKENAREIGVQIEGIACNGGSCRVSCERTGVGPPSVTPPAHNRPRVRMWARPATHTPLEPDFVAATEPATARVARRRSAACSARTWHRAWSCRDDGGAEPRETHATHLPQWVDRGLALRAKRVLGRQRGQGQRAGELHVDGRQLRKHDRAVVRHDRNHLVRRVEGVDRAGRGGASVSGWRCVLVRTAKR